MDNYRKSLAWSAEDQLWIATSPDFPGISAVGETEPLALDELARVLEDAIAIYDAEGWTVPRATPARETEYSGQLRLRLPRALHAQAANAAEHEGISLNSLLVSFIAKGLGGIEVLDVARQRLQSLLPDTLRFAPTLYYSVGAYAYNLVGTTATMQPLLPRDVSGSMQQATIDSPWSVHSMDTTGGRLTA